MSFIEFLRTYWNLERQHNANANANNGPVPAVQVPAAPLPAPRRPVRNINIGPFRGELRARADARRMLRPMGPRRMRFGMRVDVPADIRRDPPLDEREVIQANIARWQDNIDRYVNEGPGPVGEQPHEDEVQHPPADVNGPMDPGVFDRADDANADLQQEPMEDIVALQNAVEDAFEAEFLGDEVEGPAQQGEVVPNIPMAAVDAPIAPIVDPLGIENINIEPIRGIDEDEAPVDLFEADGEFDDQNELVEFFEAQDRQGQVPVGQANLNAAPQPPVRNIQPAAVAPGVDNAQRQMDNEQAMFALNDLFGLHNGPLYPVVKNFLIVLLFNLVYVTTVAILPYAIGLRMAKLLHMYCNQVVNNVFSPIATGSQLWALFLAAVDWAGVHKVAVFVAAVRKICTEANQVVRVDDIATIGVGYMTLSFLITVVSELIHYLSESPLNRLISGQIIESINGKAMALNKTVKVGSKTFEFDRDIFSADKLGSYPLFAMAD